MTVVALDAKFGIEGCFRHLPDCRNIDAQSSSGTHCGSSFGESCLGSACGGGD